MQPQTEPKQIGSKIHNVVRDSPTPIKAAAIDTSPAHSMNPTSCNFTFRRESSMGLSLEAKRMMEETRAEAASIRAKLVAEAAEQKQVKSPVDSLSCTRKIAHPKGRFSDVHRSVFNQMDSIASHGSAWRANADRTTIHSSLKRPNETTVKLSSIGAPNLASLKRSRSKTDLGKTSSNDTSRNATPTTTDDQTPSAKRFKKGDVVTPSRIPTIAVETLKTGPSNPRGMLRSALYTPTKASLARSKSVQTVRTTQIPGLHRRQTISRPNFSTLREKAEQSPKVTTPTFQLATKSSTQKVQDQSHVVKPTFTAPQSRSQSSEHIPRTPDAQRDTSSVELIAPTPSPSRTQVFPAARPLPHPPLQSPKPVSSAFKIKSILRTPIRLYSNDPEKIAAGTHMATPPSVQVPATAPVAKRVNFTASTQSKADKDETQIPPEQMAVIYPQLPTSAPHNNQIRNAMTQNRAPGDFTFRAGDEIKFGSPLVSTIRTVRTSNESPSTRMAQPGTKRKLVAYESSPASIGQDPEHDKENSFMEEVERPSKRIRATNASPIKRVSKAAPTSNTQAVTKKKPTAPSSSIRPAQRQGGISVSRLAYLSQPKKR